MRGFAILAVAISPLPEERTDGRLDLATDAFVLGLPASRCGNSSHGLRRFADRTLVFV